MGAMFRALVATWLVATPAWADDGRVVPVTDPIVLRECGACHMAFQPAFLPARSWAQMMTGLADHFGEPVSLSADRAAAIGAFYARHAGDVADPSGASRFMRWVAPQGVPVRITDNPAFQRAHRHIPDRTWTSARVVTKSNCPACHRGAEQGWYDDD